MGGSWLQTTIPGAAGGSAGAIASRSAGRDASILRWSSGSCACRFARSRSAFLILDYTPQAQDLFTEFADHCGRMALFRVAAHHRLGRHDALCGKAAARHGHALPCIREPAGSPFLTWAETWVPRVLGLVPFAMVLIASERSIWNLPEIEDAGDDFGHQIRRSAFSMLLLWSPARVPCLHGEAPGSDESRPC